MSNSIALQNERNEARERAAKLQTDLTLARACLASARAALIECANVIRPHYPSFSDNVIGAHLNEINSLIGPPKRDARS